LDDIRGEEEPDEVPEEFREAFRMRGRWRGQPPTPQYLRNKRKLDELLAKLEAKDRDIMFTSFKYLDTESGKFTLPEEERDRLCREWNFATPNALSQYRKRKIAELRNVLATVA
jgi:hypothetical protein